MVVLGMVVMGVDAMAMAVPMPMPMRGGMAMTIAMIMATIECAPRRNRDPAAESDQRKARGRVYPMAEFLSEGDTGTPDHKGNDECRYDMARARFERGARRLRLRPAALTRDQRDRHPMVGHQRMENAHRGDRPDQQELRSEVHFFFSPCVWR